MPGCVEQGLCRKGLAGPWWLGSIHVGGPCPGPTGYCPRCDSRCMEAPDTAQAHSIAYACQDKLDPVCQLPCWRLWSSSVASLGTAPFCADRRKATISEASA